MPSTELRAFGSKLICVPCKTNYNRNNERLINDRSPNGPGTLNKWWEDLGVEGQQQWYQKNRSQAKNHKRSFDDVIEIHDTKKSKHDMDQVIAWLPEDLYYFDYQKPRGLTRAQSDEAFKEQCSAGNGKEISNVWHVKVYKGMEEKTGTSREKAVVLRRSQRMSAETIGMLESEGAEQRRWAQNRCKENMSQMDIDTPEIDSRFMPKQKSDNDDEDTGRLLISKQKDYVRKHEEECAMADSQAQDEHEANELNQMKRRSSGGRPTKAKSEMLLDATTLLRGRRTAMEQKVESTKLLLDDIWAEAQKAFSEGIPQDLETLHTTVQSEHAAAKQQLDAHIAKLSEVDPKTLVEAASNALELRTKLAGISKTEIAASLKACDCCVQSLRKGLITATNGGKAKKSKDTEPEVQQDRGPFQRALTLRASSGTGAAGLCDKFDEKRMRVCFTRGSDKDVKQLLKAGIKGQFTWLKQQVKLPDSDSLIVSAFSPLVEGKVTKVLKESRFQ